MQGTTSTPQPATQREVRKQRRGKLIIVGFIVVIILSLVNTHLAGTWKLLVPAVYEDFVIDAVILNKSDARQSDDLGVFQLEDASNYELEFLVIANQDRTDVNDGEQVHKEDLSVNEEDELKHAKKLNVLLLYVDDWRWDMLGSVNPAVKTPFLDSLASEGIRFSHNFVTSSVCWLSRATLFTGQYFNRHKSYKLRCPRFSFNKDQWQHTWPAMLQRAGYYLGHIGKWQYHDYPSPDKGYFNYSNYFEGQHWYDVFPKRKVHGSDLCAERAIEFLEKKPKDINWALTVAFYVSVKLIILSKPLNIYLFQQAGK